MAGSRPGNKSMLRKSPWASVDLFGWTDGEPDVNRHMVKNTNYAAWFAALENGEHG